MKKGNMETGRSQRIHSDGAGNEYLKKHNLGEVKVTPETVIGYGWDGSERDEDIVPYPTKPRYIGTAIEIKNQMDTDDELNAVRDKWFFRTRWFVKVNDVWKPVERIVGYIEELMMKNKEGKHTTRYLRFWYYK